MIYTLQVSPDDIAILGRAIDQLPHGQVKNLIAKVQAQISATDQAIRESYEAQERKAQAKAEEDARNAERLDREAAQAKDELAAKRAAAKAASPIATPPVAPPPIPAKRKRKAG